MPEPKHGGSSSVRGSCSGRMEKKVEPLSEGAGQKTANMKETVPDEKQIMQWIAAKPLPDQEQATREHFRELLESASQPRHASGNTCVKLCYFLDLCRNSTSATQREVAFSRRTCLDLFKFYIEWNEKNQHRSMRQVLELLISLIMLNPDKEVSSTIKVEILKRVLSIITHQSAQPLVKPSFKVLECFLGKEAMSVTDLIEVYGGKTFTESQTQFQCYFQEVNDPDLLHSFVYAVFDWMSLPDTSPAAGKLLVTLFQKMRAASMEQFSSNDETYTILWQQWIRHGLMKHPDALENIRNYLFPPLFKIDRMGSLKFLQDLVRDSHFKGLGSLESDAQAFLLLSAMEVGKKSGLVDDPHVLLSSDGATIHNSMMLPEYSIGELLNHRAGNVRSAAFSVLVSSVSSIRPLSLMTFNLLRENLELLHSDTDAKVRNEVLSNTKHMVGRMKGAVSFLTREVVSNHIKQNRMLPKENSKHPEPTDSASQKIATLQEHHDFILWYKNFLTNELIPTASYQRHITALRAIQIVVDSDIPIQHDKTSFKFSINIKSQEQPSENMFTQKLMRLLLDLVMNPFEDVRASATQLLKLAPRVCFTLQGDVESSHHRKPHDFSLLLESVFNQSEGKSWVRAPADIGGRERPQQAKVPGVLASFIQKAETLSKLTGRADLADGVARTYELTCCFQSTDEGRLGLLESLVYDLEMKVAIAEKDLAQAVLQAPVHGHFAALRLVWDAFAQPLNTTWTWQQPSKIPISKNPLVDKVEDNSIWIGLQKRMIGCCTRIWDTVKDVLCNDSPEGHLPQDLDEIDALDTKDVLSYSFRAIHESSNLLRVMANKLKLNLADDSPIVPFEVFHAAGKLSFEQLSHLRHRGAFSTVSLTFARCCQLTKENSIVGHPGSSLLKEWYQGALMCINEQSSTTRRSAGIPSLMIGILSANSKSPALEDVMAQLKALACKPAVFTANDRTNIPQVHAMNCLKEIFKSSSLGKRCENHIADCLQIAAESLKSKIWAIRNCGLLLLRSLIDCLFGTSESKSVTEAGWDGKSIRLAYGRYPALPGILLNLMAADHKEQADHTSPQIGAIESVFPALDIIRRAGPPTKLRAEIHACIKVHLGSNIWHVRDIAARTICTLLLDDKWLEGLTDLLETCGNSTNQIHGVLLATKYFLERKLELSVLKASEGLSALIPRLDHFWATKQHWRLDTIIEAAHVEVSFTILKIVHLTGNAPIKTHTDEGNFKRACLLLKAGHLSAGERDLTRIIQPNFIKRSSALLLRAVAIHALYTAVTSKKLDQLQELITFAIQYDPDVASDVLTHISDVWNLRDCKVEDLTKLANIHIGACSSTSSNAIQTIALRNLADVIDHLSQSGWLEQTNITSNNFREFRLSLLNRGSPDLSNAEIRLTGSLLALDFLHHTQQENSKEIDQRIQAWGEMIIGNGRSENDFDTRYAATAALHAFYCACCTVKVPLSQTPSMLPSLFALYDTLNDDDEEIRDAGSNVVLKILGSHQAPLTASAKLLKWLHQNFGKTEAFRTAMMHRIANNNRWTDDELEPAEQQLAAAMQNDDSLFVEEEQNLYIDEVREAVAWNSLLTTAGSPFSDDQAGLLSSWAVEGLRTLGKLVETEDGAFGWSTKPRVFAICMKVILAAKAMIVCYDKDSGNGETTDSGVEYGMGVKGKPLQDAICFLLDVGRRNDLHPVLLDELAKSSA